MYNARGLFHRFASSIYIVRVQRGRERTARVRSGCAIVSADIIIGRGAIKEEIASKRARVGL